MTPLHVHSWFSMLQGVESPESLVCQAARLGYHQMALTDTNGLYGAIEFRDAAIRNNIRPIFGATVEVHQQRCVALAENRGGYANLCRLITAIHRDRTDQEATERRSLLQLIPQYAEGLHLLVADPVLAAPLHKELGSRQVWLEIIRPGNRTLHWKLWQLHEKHGIPLIASTNAHFISSEGFEQHRIARAIAHNTLLESVPYQLTNSTAPPHVTTPTNQRMQRSECHITATPCHKLLAPCDIERLFADLPVAVRNTQWLSEQCESDVLPQGPFIPQSDVPRGYSAEQYLLQLCQDGVGQRYSIEQRHRPVDPRRAEERLRREMSIITQRNLADYFLVVRDIVMFSRQRGLPVALRGSGGNCLTAYLIGITDVDPLEYNLPIERFLHEGREDLPDLDIDFCWRVRDQVIDYVFERFGRDNTAMISTHITLQSRSAFREVAKVYGLSQAEVTHLVHNMPRPVREEMNDQLADIPSVPVDSDRANVATIMRSARQLIGAPQHLSVHPGGIVITPTSIDGFVPIQRSAKGVMITQFEKDAAEATGLVKIDLLGNRSLSTVSAAIRDVREQSPHSVNEHTSHPHTSGNDSPVTFTSYRVPVRDKATAQLLQQGDTVGVGQLESPAMRHLLIQLQPESLYDVMQALALIRPGAASIGCKELFVKRRRGVEPPSLIHETVRCCLEETYGLMLYEDDAMNVVSAMTGMSLAESDRFRKAITKCRNDQERATWTRDFLTRAVAHGVPYEAACEQWIHVAKFNSYSFCKSHAASYAQLAWASAYLKTHYPVSFWVAALNNNQGLYEKRVYVEEMKRRGIHVSLPCANRSEDEFSRDHVQGSDTVRIGLNQIMGLSQTTRDRIVTERKQNQYRSLYDFRTRTAVGPEELALLIRSGALDFTQINRPTLLLQARLSPQRSRQQLYAERQQQRLFEDSDFQAATPSPPLLNDYSQLQQLRDEFSLLHLNTRDHWMAILRPIIRGDIDDSRELSRRVGKRISLAGIVATARHVPTKHGEMMQFVTLEDEYGLFEVTIFPDLCSRTPYLELGPYLVHGKVDHQLGVLTVTADRFELAENSVPHQLREKATQRQQA